MSLAAQNVKVRFVSLLFLRVMHFAATQFRRLSNAMPRGAMNRHTPKDAIRNTAVKLITVKIANRGAMKRSHCR